MRSAKISWAVVLRDDFFSGNLSTGAFSGCNKGACGDCKDVLGKFDSDDVSVDKLSNSSDLSIDFA